MEVINVHFWFINYDPLVSVHRHQGLDTSSQITTHVDPVSQISRSSTKYSHSAYVFKKYLQIHSISINAVLLFADPAVSEHDPPLTPWKDGGPPSPTLLFSYPSWGLVNDPAVYTDSTIVNTHRGPQDLLLHAGN